MSKIKLFLDVVADLRSLADSVQSLTDALAGNKTATDSRPELSAPAADTVPAVKSVTLEEVRAVLASMSHDGFTAEVRALLEKHGAKKLSEIDPARYAALLADAEGLK